MSSFLCRGFAFAAAAMVFAAQGETSLDGDETERPVYYFVSGNLNAKSGSGHYPMVTMTKRHIVVQRSSKLRKISRDAPIIIQLRPLYTDTVVEARNLEVDFSSSLPARAEAEAISQMFRYEIGTEQEIALLENVASGNGRFRRNYDQIEELKQDSLEFQSSVEDLTLNRTYDLEDRSDTVFLSFELLPEYDYEDAYLAVAVSWTPRGQNTDGDRRTRTQVFSKYIGTLEANKVKEVKVRHNLERIVPKHAECELFLFHGEGQAIATTLSRGLREVGHEKADEIRGQLNP